ncbi:MAG: tRNA (adenosine(37)-N6)-dimethylallyltransferase MiaA [Candidatus Nanopelagicales bacterium]
MTMNPLVILGPTASGKSQLGIHLAQCFDGEIVSLDAYQIYRGMDIATAKITNNQGIAHHMIDIVDITHQMSVSEFQLRARHAISDIQERGRLPILVGGSALYIQAVLYDFEFQATDPAVRDRLIKLSKEIASEELHAKLSRVDPDAASQISVADTKRIIRALEVNEITGAHYKFGLSDIEPHIEHTKIGLKMNHDILRIRVRERVNAMLRGGLVAEVTRLQQEGLFQTVTASKAIGYEDAYQLAKGEVMEEDALDAITQKTMLFVKKQMKWFKRDTTITWFDALDVNLYKSVEDFVEVLVSKSKF